MLATLRQRNFALLWTGGLISLAGNRMLSAALPFYIYERTHSTMVMAVMVAASMVPSMLLGSVAGVFVDRWDRKRVMVIANLLQAPAVLLLLLVNSEAWIGLAYVVMFAQSAIEAFFGPAETALLPRLVSDEHLVSANSLNALNNRLARLFGPPLGGTLLAFAGLDSVVIIDAITFLAAALLIARIAAPPRAATAVPAGTAGRHDGKWWVEWLDGLRFVARRRSVAVLFLVLTIVSFGGTMFDPLYPAFAESVLRAGPQSFGWLVTASAWGGIAGGLVIGKFGKVLSPVALLGWGCVTVALLLLVMFNFPTLLLAFAIFFAVGLAATAVAVAADTLVQRMVPDAYMGRVVGVLGATINTLSLFGVLGLSGALGDVVGIVPMMNVGAGVTLLAGALALVLLREPHLA